MKTATRFHRQVIRFVEKSSDDSGPKQVTLDMNKLSALPKELEGEPKMVLVENDIVQISNQRSDGWAFGTKVRRSQNFALYCIFQRIAYPFFAAFGMP